MNRVSILVMAAVAGAAGFSVEGSPPVRLIFDTDMMGDVDDVGTAAVLQALADRGEVEILAMGLSGKNPWSPLCLDALNTYFRRPEIPIGVVKGPAWDRDSRYAEAIAREFPRRLESVDLAPDAAQLYRKILAEQPDGSVVIVSVGQLTNLRNLLRTGSDEHHELAGGELVARKVRIWVCMGGKIPEGREANLVNDGPAAAEAIANWPTPIIFSGWEIGQEIMTGARLRAAPDNSPVRRAYELFNDLSDRQSWDQTAVLYAVRGLDGGLDDYWDLQSGGHLHVNEDGSNQWRESPDKDHAYLVRKMPPEQIAAVLEDLMLHTPAGPDEDADTVLFDFSGPGAAAQWQAVNDGVMGGVSRGSFRITEQKTMEFLGDLSLENSGGFASVRTRPGRIDLSAAQALRLRVRGDGRTYLFNIYVPSARIAFSYRAPLRTQKDTWTEVTVPLSAFKANSFGREVAGPPLDPANVQSIGLMLSDKQPGPFKLEVAWIKSIAK
jgi:purine nucleosidase